MIKPSLFRQLRIDNDADVPSVTWPGGYPIIYITTTGDVLCADCVNGGNDSDVRTQDDPAWNVAGFSLHLEGPPEFCAHCDAEIESAYGDENE